MLPQLMYSNCTLVLFNVCSWSTTTSKTFKPHTKQYHNHDTSSYHSSTLFPCSLQTLFIRNPLSKPLYSYHILYISHLTITMLSFYIPNPQSRNFCDMCNHKLKHQIKQHYMMSYQTY